MGDCCFYLDRLSAISGTEHKTQWRYLKKSSKKFKFTSLPDHRLASYRYTSSLRNLEINPFHTLQIKNCKTKQFTCFNSSQSQIHTTAVLSASAGAAQLHGPRQVGPAAVAAGHVRRHGRAGAVCWRLRRPPGGRGGQRVDREAPPHGPQYGPGRQLRTETNPADRPMLMHKAR